MKNKRILTGVLFSFASLAAPAITWPQTEPVNGYYDTANDWFVFEWSNPEVGKMRAIYDSSGKVKPNIRGTVSLEQGTGVFIYSFQFGNQAGAAQLLQKIFIDHRSAILDSTTPSNEWDGGEYRNMGVWEYDKSLGSIRGIPAGQTVSGFSFKSKGLPTIVNVEFAGKRRARASGPNPDSDSEEVLQAFVRVKENLREQYPDKFADTVRQKTIGPVDPPANITPIQAIDYIGSLGRQSIQLGWVKDSGWHQSLVAKYIKAKNKITAGDFKTAKKIMNALLNEIKAQQDKKITSEGFALLYYNIKYLVDHL